MSQSYTTTTTNAYTISNTRYITDKIAADLQNVSALFPNVLSSATLESWKQDIFAWIKSGYAESVVVEFKRNGNGKVARGIRWSLKADGTITSDHNTGRLGLKDLDGMSAHIVVNTSPAWERLSSAAQQQFYRDSLSPGWGPASQKEYEDGYWNDDRQYSQNLLGVQRAVFGGRS